MPRPSSDLSIQIVHAARACFLRDGVEGASLREIAREAKTNIGMVYYYFSTKEDLFSAVIEEVYVGLISELEVLLQPNVAVEERSRRVFGRLAALREEEFLVLRLVIREVLVSSERATRLLQRFSQEGAHLPLLFSFFAEGVDSGHFEASHPLAMLLSFASLGILSQILFRTLRGVVSDNSILPIPEELARELHSMFLKGLAAK